MKTATGFWLWLLRYVNHWAVTTPWCIYCVPEQINNAQLLKHENVHVEQIRRDGVLPWLFKSAYYAMKYTREQNPYEIEARAVSGLA